MPNILDGGDNCLHPRVEAPAESRTRTKTGWVIRTRYKCLDCGRLWIEEITQEVS